MPTFAVWLASMVGPLAARALTSLGMSIVTYVGLTSAVNAALDASKASLGGLSSDVAAVVQMAGLFDAMSIMAGGLIGGLAFVSLSKLTIKT